MSAHGMEGAVLRACIDGIGFWAPGLPSWDAARAFALDGTRPEAAPARPSPQLLAPNERRRAPETVAVALDVALAACVAAGRGPAALPSVFASTHGELAITDYMCATLASDPRSISPTRFHNSVHNAAAGYWTIGAGAMQPATAISAYDGSFAQGLLEALVQLDSGADAVLLVGYDSQAVGPLGPVCRSTGLLGAALVLAREPRADALVLEGWFARGDAPAGDGPLARHAAGNAMAPMLPLFDALARRDAPAMQGGDEEAVALHAGPGQRLQLRIHR